MHFTPVDTNQRVKYSHRRQIPMTRCTRLRDNSLCLSKLVQACNVKSGCLTSKCLRTRQPRSSYTHEFRAHVTNIVTSDTITYFSHASTENLVKKFKKHGHGTRSYVRWLTVGGTLFAIQLPAEWVRVQTGAGQGTPPAGSSL